MVQDDGMHWELLNNEIRHVTAEAEKVTFITGFRSIRNEMVFENVVWSDNLDALQGEVLNYVQEFPMEKLTNDLCERLRKDYSENFESDFAKSGRHLFKIVCNRNRSNYYLVANRLNIIVNG